MENDDDSLEIYNLSLVEFSKTRVDYTADFSLLKLWKNKNSV